MIQCANNADGRCLVAQSLARNLIAINVVESNCLSCVRSRNPYGVNESTCGLATIRLIENNLFDRERFADLIKCQKVSASVINKPGTALAKILFDAGVHESSECGCETYAAQMDFWGWQGCTDRKQEIVDHLNNQNASWLDMIKIAFAGYLSTESLVTEALKQSKP
jgi:hypothetical protein